MGPSPKTDRISCSILRSDSVALFFREFSSCFRLLDGLLLLGLRLTFLLGLTLTFKFPVMSMPIVFRGLSGDFEYAMVTVLLIAVI